MTDDATDPLASSIAHDGRSVFINQRRTRWVLLAARCSLVLRAGTIRCYPALSRRCSSEDRRACRGRIGRGRTGQLRRSRMIRAWCAVQTVWGACRMRQCDGPTQRASLLGASSSRRRGSFEQAAPGASSFAAASRTATAAARQCGGRPACLPAYYLTFYLRRSFLIDTMGLSLSAPVLMLPTHPGPR